MEKEFFLWLIPDIFCFIDFIFHCRTCSLLVFSYNRKILATWKTLHSTLRKCFGYLIHSAIAHFASPLYNSPSQQNWKLLCHSKMSLQFFAHRVKQFIQQSNGSSWLTYTKLKFQQQKKPFEGTYYCIGYRCNVLLQGSSHVTFLLMFILFVSRQKSEQSLDIHLYVYKSFCFICYWFYLCTIVLSMIVI